MTLPPLPAIDVRVIEDTTEGSRCDTGFVRVRRRKLSLGYGDGTESAVFPYDEAWRVNLDAVTIAAHFRDPQGVPHVYLRSAVRPPVALRPAEPIPPLAAPTGGLWELPAGLIEQDERTPEGVVRCAAREIEEELGFYTDPATYGSLGGGMFPTPGLIGERIYFFHVEVDPVSRREPSEDGSALERFAEIAAIPLEAALSLCRDGRIEDMKTELGLRRLAEVLAR
jgi:ADP-ribose pyrophosphatase